LYTREVMDDLSLAKFSGEITGSGDFTYAFASG
jgi:hypothetical protein